MLNVHSSNRAEPLAERLGEVLKKPLSDPMRAEVILVHSHGLERWISLQLASQLGVCANVEFPFPVPFLTELMVRNTPGWIDHPPVLLDGDSLVWALMEVLPEASKQPGAEALANYLGGDGARAGVRLYQLSQTLGRLLDRYQLYRPQILQRWINGRVLEGERWQAIVWQALVQRAGPYHRLALKRDFQEHLRRSRPDKLANLPPRITLFGLTSLAPYFVDVLSDLAPLTELHLFFLNPSQEYWGDILSRKQRARISKRQRHSGRDPGHQLELGLSAEPNVENELLACLGKMGRDFFDLLLDLDSAIHEETFVTPVQETTLCALQRDILRLREGEGTIDRAREASSPSLQVHSCHSRMREIEVLNDILLDLLEKDPDLTPRDVVVMAPRIEDYSSKIRAVFGRPREDERFIPFDIADRTPRLSHTLSSALLRLLALPETRWEVREVLGVLESSPVMRRFGLTETTLDTLRHWLAESGVCWGRDAEAKARLNLPDTYENTWQFGLDRLLLGYAMPKGNRSVFAGVLPYDHVAEGDLDTLDAFLTFWDQLKDLEDELEQPHPAGHWAELGRQIVGRFFIDDPEYERELNTLYQVFDELEAATARAGFTGDLSLPVIRAHVEERLDEVRTSGGFFTGGVTFCNLLPMRSIPFSVVVLLGMDGREFPRRDRQLSFDLIQAKPVRGDRTRLEEDRYMFLEALLAARGHFIILYRGQSVRDNSELSPSALVTHLRDYLERVYNLPAESYSRTHRLQPFNAAYFDPRAAFRSYARAYLESAPSLARDSPSAFDEEAPEETPEKIVTVDELIRFFQHPVAAYYQNAFGLYRPREPLEATDVEPVDLCALEAWHLDQWLLELVEADHPTAEIEKLLKGSGRIPHGAHGASEIHHLLASVDTFRQQKDQFLRGPALAPVPVDLPCRDWQLRGEIRGLRQGGLRRVRFGRLRPQECFQLWIEHLVLQSLPDQPHQPSAILGRKAGTKRETETFALRDFDAAQAQLQELGQLLELRQEGLQRPLPIFPRSSMAFARSHKRSKPFADCKKRAYDEWHGRNGKIPEKNDYYHQLAFGKKEDPLDQEFCDLCEKTVRPLLESEWRDAKL